MRDFMREADKRNYRMDYIGVHWYGGTSPRSFKERMIEVYEAYGRRPLLISEFAVADWGAKSIEQNSHSKESVLKFMKDVLLDGKTELDRWVCLVFLLELMRRLGRAPPCLIRMEI